MKQQILKFYFLIVILLSNFLMFAADDPGTGFEDAGGGTGGNVEAAPIDGWLIYVMLIGIAFVFYYLKSKKNVTSS